MTKSANKSGSHFGFGRKPDESPSKLKADAAASGKPDKDRIEIESLINLMLEDHMEAPPLSATRIVISMFQSKNRLHMA